MPGVTRARRQGLAVDLSTFDTVAGKEMGRGRAKLQLFYADPRIANLPCDTCSAPQTVRGALLGLFATCALTPSLQTQGRAKVLHPWTSPSLVRSAAVALVHCQHHHRPAPAERPAQEACGTVARQSLPGSQF